MNPYLADSDILFSPDRWSKRFPPNVIFEKHLEIITKYSKETREKLKCHQSTPYGHGKREIIDVYGTDLDDDAPICVYVHGGYWQEEAINHRNNVFPTKCLHKNGIKSIFIGYELCPHVTIEEMVRNIEKAVGRCLDYGKTHKTRGLYLIGHSAGAHLMIMLFTTFIPSLSEEDQLLFKGAFLICGLYDLTPLVKTRANEALELDEDSAREVSPLHRRLSAIGTNFYVIVAQHDSPVFFKQGRQFHDHLLGFGLSSKYVSVENVDHYEIIENLINEEFQLTQIIIQTVTTQA